MRGFPSSIPRTYNIGSMPLFRRAVRFLPAALVYSVITVLSSRTEFPVEAPFSSFDKIVHLAEFILLGAALAFAVFGSGAVLGGRRSFRRAAGLWVAGTGLGLLDEVHQIFVPGRSADAGDAAADAIGVALGIGLYLVLRRRASRL